MDASGDAWAMAALDNGDWCYYEVGPGGGTVHKFKLPTAMGYDEPMDPPIFTFDGAVWAEMGRNPDELMRVKV